MCLYYPFPFFSFVISYYSCPPFFVDLGFARLSIEYSSCFLALMEYHSVPSLLDLHLPMSYRVFGLSQLTSFIHLLYSSPLMELLTSLRPMVTKQLAALHHFGFQGAQFDAISQSL